MQKILIIKSIFCPNYLSYESTINSLIKLLFYIKLHEINAKIILIGWLNNFYDNFSIFLKLFSTNFQSFDIITFDHNYGKCYMFNKLMDSINKNDFDIFIYFDHDIYIDLLNKNIINIINSVINQKVSGKNIGLITFDQLEDNRHQLDIYENTVNVNNNIICWPDTIISLACGAFAIKTEIFFKLKKFPLISNYGTDDTCLLTQLYDMGYVNIMLKNISVVHPFNNNKCLDNYKYNIMYKLLNNIIVKYDETIEESEKLFI